MRVLIAGSNGFLGKNFFRMQPQYQDIEFIHCTRDECNISNQDEFFDFVSLKKPDAIVHCAASLSDSINNLKMYLSLEKVSSLVSKIIMVGSGCEYSHQRYRPLMEEDYYDPAEPPINSDAYHNSKFMIARLHSQSHCRNIYNFRVFGLYGLYEDYSRRLITNNIYNYLSNGSMTFNKDISFDYLFVDDLINTIIFFLRTSITPQHQTYNVCSGVSEKFSVILGEVIDSLGGSRSDITCADTSNSNYSYSGSNKRFQNEFNYTIRQSMYCDTTPTLASWIKDLVGN